MMSKTIYIADDETSIRLAIKAFLENAGFDVEDFETGDLLLERFRDVPSDLVVTDVMMPGSNGFVVCKELRRISRVPIILLTARDSDLDYATGLDLGSDDYLTKPFSPMALVMRVKAIFRRMEFDRLSYDERERAAHGSGADGPGTHDPDAGRSDVVDEGTGSAGGASQVGEAESAAAGGASGE
ncbi:MAG: response regulator transcription factor [Propionibacteriaceae bacterium]|jgi:DNA-binding response OmpR family regulator|nr:response regulator transcription factor [Propionibacteriaceae bacterium]